MGNSRSKREQAKVTELARKYRKEGFDVFVDPDNSLLPRSLQRFNHTPDLIVIKGDENLAIEVKTSATVTSVREFGLFVDALKEDPNWDSVFVLTNPKYPEDPDVAGLSPSYEAAANLLNQAKRLSNQRYMSEFSDALVLITNASIEAVLRNALYGFRKHHGKKRVDVEDLPRDAVIYGLIGERTADKYEVMQEMAKKVIFGKTPMHGLQMIDEKLISDLQKLLDQGVLSSDFSDNDKSNLG